MVATLRRVLVTGAAGYIGQHLVGYLCEQGSLVRGFSRRLRPAHLPPLEWYQGDINKLDDLLPAMQHCDVVVHLACLPLLQSQQDPMTAFQTNGVGTLNVLQIAHKLGNIQVIYTSTAQVYGHAEQLPMREDDPVYPNSPYAASKLWGELACQSYAQQFNLPVTILRLFNVYGFSADGSERPTVETLFIKRILSGQPPLITGSADEGRDFIHISDVIRSIRLAMDRVLSGEIFNVGSGALTTLPELAQILARLIGAETGPDIREDNRDPLQMQADMTKIGKYLGFQPQMMIEDGLARIIERIRSN